MASRPFTPVLLAGTLLAVALTTLGWLDYRAVSQELQTVVRAQAAALHATVAAAARAQHAAAEHAEAALTERLLESARLLRELDRAGALTTSTLDNLTTRNTHTRVVVFGRDGLREFAAGESPGRGRGDASGPHRGRGPFGGPGSGARLVERLLSGEGEELVTPPHTSQAGAERVAAGVRRSNGGAIIVNAAADAAQRLDDVYSLAALLTQIAQATPALAYIVVDDAGRRVSEGPLAGVVVNERGQAAPSERDRVVQGIRVLERRSPIDLGDNRSAELRIGMRLDDVVRGERRTIVRIGAGLTAAVALTVVALAFVSLRQRFGVLSAEHARAQEALRTRDRLAAMGELASTVAHEIRNPLNAIAMSAQRLGREYPRPASAAERDELSDLLEVIQHESARINQTVQQFLDYARPRPLNRQDVAVGPWLEEISRSASPVADARGVRITTRALGSLHATIDPAQLREAVDNLVRNAIEASPSGGTVALEAQADGRGMAVLVADEGAGISEDILPRIFDLYFTTKAHGTGIGLAVAQQIVMAHGGTIEVDSAPGRGTRMRVRIPADRAVHG